MDEYKDDFRTVLTLSFMILSIFYQISPFYYIYDHFTAAYVLSVGTKTVQCLKLLKNMNFSYCDF